MRVAIVTDLGIITGAARSWQRLMRTLAEQYGRDGVKAKDLEIIQIARLHTSPYRYEERDNGAWFFEELEVANRAGPIDLVHIWYGAGSAASAAAYFAIYRLIPYVVSLRGMDIGGADFDPARAEGLRYVIRNADYITGVTWEIINRALAFGEKPLHDFFEFEEIYNSFEPRDYYRPTLLTAEPPPSPNPPIIGALANWQPRTKGLHVLLEAFNLLVESWGDGGGDAGEPPMLRIMGRVEGEAARRYDDAVRHMSEGVRARIVLDEQPLRAQDVLIEMAKCTLGVIPSTWDACPNVLYEWVAAGVPVVTTNTGAMPDLTPYPDLTAEPGDVETLTGAIERGLTNTYNTTQLAEQFIKKHDPETEAFYYYKIYKQLLRKA